MQLLFNLLRSTSCTRTVLGSLMYSDIHSGSCATIAYNLSSLVTIIQKLSAFGGEEFVYVE